MNPLPRQFGKYVLQRRLGVGGMAETFVARREGDVGQLVCLKRVLPAYNADKDFVHQFVREAQVAAKLRHSHIVGILEFGAVGQEQYMALELVDGVDMRGLLAMEPDKQLDPELAALIGIDMAYALEYAHEAEGGIVHRDVTPSNILLSRHGEVKLADFGVAKALSSTSVATATGFIKGKVPYMAPEQMRGAEIDGRVDLFSLGVTLYEALAGRRPFVGKHDVEVMMKVLEGDRPPLAELAPHVPIEFCAVVERLLELDRDDRLPDGGAVVDALAPFLSSEASARDRLAEKVRAAYGAEASAEIGTQDTMLATEVPEEIVSATPVAADPVAAGPEVIAAPEVERRSPALWVGLVTAILIAGVAVAAFAFQGDPEVPVDDPVVVADAPDQNVAENAPDQNVPDQNVLGMEALPQGAETPPAELANDATGNEVADVSMDVAMDVAHMETASRMVPRRTGMVRVRVLPWGDVYYRGRNRGRAPKTLTLPVGMQSISAGQDGPSVTRQVTVVANETRELRIEL